MDTYFNLKSRPVDGKSNREHFKSMGGERYHTR